ncbi:MAG: class I SAM-dependent methyltransferase [Anaerolineaceae bacterium]|nr:class I SAM-dependent methyltransferase [Anaerolineaceae bacterium]
MEKIKIEKNSVQETLVLPLYGKAWASQNYPDIFKDRDARKIMNSIDYDFSAMEKAARGVKGKIASLAAATRQAALVWEINDYLKDHPKALVVNLGCGLDTAGHQADNGKCRFANVDFPNVIELREKLLPSTERERNIPSDLNDHSWFEKIGFIKEDGAVFIASGVFLYFKKDDVKKLFCAMAERFPGARLAFDGQNEAGKNLDLKALQTSGIDISTNFSLNHPEAELRSWSDKFARVQWKKMSTGYIQPDKRFGLLYRLMALYADNTGMSQLDVIDFQKD